MHESEYVRGRTLMIYKQRKGMHTGMLSSSRGSAQKRYQSRHHTTRIIRRNTPILFVETLTEYRYVYLDTEYESILLNSPPALCSGNGMTKYRSSYHGDSNQDHVLKSKGYTHTQTPK